MANTMIKKIIGERIFCGLDIGSQSIKASLIKIHDDRSAELLGIYEIKTVGFKEGSVTDLADLAECIHAAVSGLIENTAVKIKDIQVGIGGNLVETRLSKAVIPLADRSSKVISYRDIKKVEEQARLLGTKIEEEILHDFPQSYVVDDVNIALNPFGLFGRKLEVNLFLIVSKAIHIRNITSAVNQAGYEVSNIFFSSYVSSEIVFDEKIKEKGCALIDIGATMTDILIFKDGRLRDFIKIPLGGSHVTKSIAQNLTIAFDLAEDIKKSYADAISTPLKAEEEILVKKEEGYLPVKRQVIYESIEPEIARLVDSITAFIKKSSYFDQLNEGIIMVGGGALLPGLIERIEQSTNLSVTMGKLEMIKKSLHNAGVFTATVGLAKGGYHKTFGHPISTNGHKPAFSRLGNKIRELYQEYF